MNSESTTNDLFHFDGRVVPAEIQQYRSTLLSGSSALLNSSSSPPGRRLSVLLLPGIPSPQLTNRLLINDSGLPTPLLGVTVTGLQGHRVYYQVKISRA